AVCSTTRRPSVLPSAVPGSWCGKIGFRKPELCCGTELRRPTARGTLTLPVKWPSSWPAWVRLGSSRQQRALEFSKNAHNLLLQRPAGDVHFAPGIDKNIHLAAHAEFWQIDAWLDGEARPRHYEPLFVGFEIVHIRAVAVDFLADVVPGAMDELLAVPCLDDHVATGLIDLPALERTASGKSGADLGNRRGTSRGHDFEDPHVFLGHLPANKADARQIAIDAPRLVEFGPQVDEHKVAFLHAH